MQLVNKIRLWADFYIIRIIIVVAVREDVLSSHHVLIKMLIKSESQPPRPDMEDCLMEVRDFLIFCMLPAIPRHGCLGKEEPCHGRHVSSGCVHFQSLSQNIQRKSEAVIR